MADCDAYPPNEDHQPVSDENQLSPPTPCSRSSKPSRPSMSSNASRVSTHEEMCQASGHGIIRRTRFAHSLTGPFLVISLVAMGKDVYIIEFGASASVIGSIMLVFSLASPALDGLIGTLQDRAALRRFFPVEEWGRRAPWFGTHNAASVPLTFAFFFPPSYDQTVLYLWFAALRLVWYWCLAAAGNAFEASRVELYPFKEERMIIEKYCKLTVVIGMVMGFTGAFLCLSFPVRGMFLGVSTVASAVILSSNLAVNVFRETRSARPYKREGIFQAFGGALKSPLVQRIIAIRTLQGIYESIIFTLQIYYLTYVYKLDNTTRLFWFGVSAFGMASAELTLAPLWSFIFARSTKLMLWIPLVLRTCDCIMAPVILLNFREPLAFVLYFVSWRVCNSSYSYWRIAASGWVIDHENRGEGMLVGLVTMVANFGIALSTSVIVLGLGWAGLRVNNCLDLQGDDREMCEYAKLNDQPESLTVYLETMFAWVAPAVELIIIILTYEFPICHGSELLEQVNEIKTASMWEKQYGPDSVIGLEEEEEEEVVSEEEADPTHVEDEELIIESAEFADSKVDAQGSSPTTVPEEGCNRLTSISLTEVSGQTSGQTIITEDQCKIKKHGDATWV